MIDCRLFSFSKLFHQTFPQTLVAYPEVISLDALMLIANDAFVVGINLTLLDPLIQGLGYATDLGRYGLNGRPKGGRSPRRSCTMRTARSRTSGENFVDFLKAPSSQVLEPPQPGRFIHAKWVSEVVIYAKRAIPSSWACQMRVSTV